MKNVTNQFNEPQETSKSFACLFFGKKCMETENVLMTKKPAMCARCGVLFDWDDSETAGYVHEIDGEAYCQDCTDGLEAKWECREELAF